MSVARTFQSMTVEIRLLDEGDESLLVDVAPGVFDDPIDPDATAGFLRDPRHHIAVAVDDDVVVGFVSAVHYIHPDKTRPEMWINEVAAAETHRRRGLARALIEAVHGAGLAAEVPQTMVFAAVKSARRAD